MKIDAVSDAVTDLAVRDGRTTGSLMLFREADLTDPPGLAKRDPLLDRRAQELVAVRDRVSLRTDDALLLLLFFRTFRLHGAV